MKRYDPYTDTIISDDVTETMFQIPVVELTEECIERIANAIVKKIKDGEADDERQRIESDLNNLWDM